MPPLHRSVCCKLHEVCDLPPDESINPDTQEGSESNLGMDIPKVAIGVE
ncbi:MAG: hypothetical protein OCU18_07790 [Candidatus Syntrophoarchaeum sp.]|nr:hypothetical protein [Candidatus Syntrophoarchaeum sp.]